MASDGDNGDTDYRLAKGYRSAAWAFWLTPPIMMPLLLFPLLNPSSFLELFAEFWELYLIFLGVPWAIGTAFWLHSRRLRSRP